MSNLHPHAVRMAAFVKSVVVTDGTGVEDLAPFQMAVVNPDTFKSVGDSSELNSMRVFVGSPNQPKQSVSYAGFYDKFNLRMPHRSMEITNVLNRSFYANVPKEAKAFVGYLGFNGLAISQGIEFRCGRTEEFEVMAYGPIVDRLYGVPEVYERFSVTTDDCPAACVDAGTCNDPIEGYSYLHKIVTQMNDPRMGHNKVRRFGKFAIVADCTTPQTYTTVASNIYQVVVPDAGNAAALAHIQASVPAAYRKSVKRVARQGIYSTYEVCNATLPTAIPAETFAVPATCESCPAGYTLTATTDQYFVRTQLAPTTDVADNTAKAAVVTALLTKYTAVTPAADGAASFIALEDGVAIIRIRVAEGTVVEPIGTDELEFIGTIGGHCEVTAPTTYAWADTGDAQRLTRTVTLSVKLNDCEEGDAAAADAILVELQAQYAGILTSIAITEEADCVASFSATQTSPDCLGSDCDTNDYLLASWDQIPAYRGQLWDIPELTINADECTLGIKVISNPINCEFSDCSYDPSEYAEYDAPMFKLYRVVDKLEHDVVGPEPTWFEAQRPAQKMLDGHAVIQELLKFRQNLGEIRFNPAEMFASKFMEAEGLVYGIKPCQKYYSLHITGDYGEVTSLSSSFGSKLNDIMLIFESRDVMDQAIAVLTGFASRSNVYLQWDK